MSDPVNDAMMRMFSDVFSGVLSKKRGRGKSQKTIELIDASYDILEQIQPCSVRAVCYQLFTRRLIKDMSKNSTNRVSRALVEAREEGTIPWEWIVDETRHVEQSATWDDPMRVFASAAAQYRKNHWADQPSHVEVWAEKGTVRGTLAPILKHFALPFRVMHGYGSATALNDIAELSEKQEKPFIALYVGDYDPSGMHMSELDIPGRISRYRGEVEIIRVALTSAHVKDENLPDFPLSSKTNDPRHGWFRGRYGHRCWELDALSPNILRDEVESAIWSYIDRAKWDLMVKMEQVEKDSVAEYMKGLPSIFGQASKYSEGDE
jgi:hypothetical protein